MQIQKQLAPALARLLDDVEAAQAGQPLRGVAVQGARMRLESEAGVRACLACPHAIWVVEFLGVDKDIELVETLGACGKFVALPPSDKNWGLASFRMHCAAAAEPAASAGPPRLPERGLSSDATPAARETSRG